MTENQLTQNIVRTRWDRPDSKMYFEVVDEETGEMTSEESRTQQHHKEGVDIRNIIAGVRKGLPIDHTTLAQPRYGDFSDVDDYMTAKNKVNEADEAFDRLPANIRKRFNHKPEALLKFLRNDANYDEAVELGLIEKPIIEGETPPKEEGEETPKD